jgi:tetratricopeptide (TPR) repeat protein
LLESAVLAFQSGKFDQAEHYCRQVSPSDHAYLSALNILGLIALQRGQLTKAEQLLKQAIKINPFLAEPNCNLAIALSGLGRFEEALESCDRALAINPNHLLTLSNRGNILLQLKRPEEALTTLDRALSIQPNFVDALCNHGSALADLRRYAEAVADFDKLLLVVPDDALALTNRGNALWALERFQDALVDYEKAIALIPDDPVALTSYGSALLYFRRTEEALAKLDQALKRQPNDPIALNNRGKALAHLGRPHEALASFDRALEVRPDYVNALINRGMALGDLKRFDDALESFNQAKTLDPDVIAAFFGTASVLLRLGNFDRGWQELDRCSQLNNAESHWRKRGKRRWLGEENIAGATILVHADQDGYGDTIQFSRYAELIAARGARVILKVQPAIKSLFAAGLKGFDRIISTGEPVPDYDFDCPVMSLPHAFRTTLTTIPATTPYLVPPSELVAAWGRRLGPKSALRVGVAWSGVLRSLPLKRYLPLFVPDIQFISLQKEVRHSDRGILQTLIAHGKLHHFGEELRDFSDTAALVSHMDIVISVCTSVGHLAAAMNKPTWFLLSHDACWRWLLDREDSPWYPSARLFRQPAINDWDSVIERATRDLSRLAAGAGS